MEHRKRGRPSTYSHARADEICKRLAGGESLRSICASDGMPSCRTFYDWMEAHPSLAQQYARARDVGLDVMADECIALADVCREGVRTRKTVTADGKVEIETVTSDMIERAKLQFLARQWYLSKLAPKRYGDQQAAGGVGAVQINLVVLPAGADSAAGSLDLRAMIRGGEVRALPAPGGDDDAAS